MNIEADISKKLSEKLNIPIDEIKRHISYPPSNLGDIALNLALSEAKRLGKPPTKVAEEIAQKIKDIDLFSDVKVIGGYINIFYDYSKLTKYIESIDDDYGKSDTGKGKRVLIEHTSANPNKAIHIGHLRNACIGDSLARLMSFNGFDTIVENYIDDTGAQVADNLVGVLYLGFPSKKQGIKIDHYFGDEVYIKVNELYEKNKDLVEKRYYVLKEIESGNKEITKLSNEIVYEILKAQLETLNKLKIFYNVIVKESEIIKYNLWKITFDMLKRNKYIVLAEEGKNKGCWVYKDEKGNEKAITRADGTVLYIGKDIAHALWKHGLIEDVFKYKKFIEQRPNEYLYETSMDGEYIKNRFNNVYESINIIGAEQALNQKIVSSIVEKLSNGKKKYVYYSYELVYLSPRSMEKLGKTPQQIQTKMSGRKGLFFDADDILEKLRKDALESVKKRNKDMPESEADKIATAIAVSTIRYEMVRTDPKKAIVFDIDETLKIEQGSAPYLLYTIARINSILRKLGEVPKHDVELAQTTEMDKELIKKLLQFPDVIERSADQLYLPPIATYVSELSLLFNKWYEVSPVIKADEKTRPLRILLIKKTKQTLMNAFNLLGIENVERM